MKFFNPPFRLIRVSDLRETDFFSGEKLPLTEGEGNTCNRCGRLHAVVWEVEDLANQQRYLIGSGCAKRAFGGWEPDKEEVKALERSARQVAKAEREAAIATRREADVVKLVEELRALGSPPQPTAGSPKYGRGGAGVDWTDPVTGVWCYQDTPPPITTERLFCFNSAWWRYHADRLMGLGQPWNKDATKREIAERDWRRQVANEAVQRLQARKNPDVDLRGLERAADEGDRTAFLTLCRELARIGQPQLESAIFFYDQELTSVMSRSKHAFELAKAEVEATRRGWHVYLNKNDEINSQADRARFVYGMEPGEAAFEVDLVDPTPVRGADGGTILQTLGPFFVSEEDFEEEPDPEDFSPDVRSAFALMALMTLTELRRDP